MKTLTEPRWLAAARRRKVTGRRPASDRYAGALDRIVSNTPDNVCDEQYNKYGLKHFILKDEDYHLPSRLLWFMTDFESGEIYAGPSHLQKTFRATEEEI